MTHSDHDSKNLARSFGVYVGWVGYGNLGDEAVWEAFQRRFPAHHWSAPHPGILLRRLLRNLATNPRAVLDAGRKEFPRVASWVRSGLTNARRGSRRMGKPRIGVLGGGTLINQSEYWLDAYRAFQKRLGAALPTFGTGVATPELWSCYPGWVDRRRQWTELLRDLPIVGVRGPISKRLLAESGARNVVVSGDPAVLFHSSLTRPVGLKRPSGQWRIGFNFSKTGIKVMHGEIAPVEEAMMTSARELVRAGHEVRLIPVFRTDVEACCSLARRAGLAEASVAPAAISAERFLHHMESLDVMVAFRLHAAILAAAANVPPVILAYQPKCVDFSETIGWARWTLSTSELTAERLLAAVAELQRDYTQLQLELSREMSSLRMQFETYCRAIEAMWSGRDAEPVARQLYSWEEGAHFACAAVPRPELGQAVGDGRSVGSPGCMERPRESPIEG